jgi:hypothetical protein
MLKDIELGMLVPDAGICRQGDRPEVTGGVMNVRREVKDNRSHQDPVHGAA